MKAPFLARLKEETLPDHLDVERMLALDDLSASLAAYHEKLRLLYAFHAPAERLLLAGVDRVDNEIAMTRRRKVHLLLDDLRTTAPDGESPLLPRSVNMEHIQAPLELLGMLYVVEGSTLGGAVIARRVHAQLALEQHNGCAFFAAYGVEVGTRWRSVCEILIRHADSRESADAIIDGARQTFAAFRARLGEGTLAA